MNAKDNLETFGKNELIVETIKRRSRKFIFIGGSLNMLEVRDYKLQAPLKRHLLKIRGETQ